MNISFSPPDISENEIQEVISTLRSGWITTGPRTKQFEKNIAEYCGTERSVCLNSATAALELSLRVLGIGPGDEVITTAYTYTASASVVTHVGAKLILIDTAPNSFEMDYEQLAHTISSKTKAIIPVDLAGIPCNYTRIFSIIESAKSLFCPRNPIQEAMGRIAIVADAAHAFGASQQNIMVGNIADFTAFSFHAVKNLTTAEGGAVTWRTINGVDNEDIYHLYQLLSLHGQSKDALAKTKLGAWEYDIVMPAYKCNMTDIMAAIGLIQLQRYPKMLARRKEFIYQYDSTCDKLGIKHLFHYQNEYQSSGHLYLTRFLGKNCVWRNSFIEKMAKNGIATNVHYKPLPMHTAYKNLGFDIQQYPHAYAMYENEVTLPLHTCLTDKDVNYVCTTLTHIFNELA